MLVSHKYKAESLDVPDHVGGWLEVDLDRVVKNYEHLKKAAPKAECCPVLKADAYGMGLLPVADSLYKAGARKFFVAHMEEALRLSPMAPDIKIFVLSGILGKDFDHAQFNNIVPVLNSVPMLQNWRANYPSKPAIIHIDTGMARLGLDAEEIKYLGQNPEVIKDLNLEGVMSHLACSNDPKHPLNHKQLELFNGIARLFPKAKRSMADTGGIFLSPDFHLDFTRPGKGLFGMFPMDGLSQAFTLRGRILQIRQANAGDHVGYGALRQLDRPSKLATIAMGFADGLDRRLYHEGHVMIGEYKAPYVGVLSMDYSVVDITDVPEHLCHEGGWVDITSPYNTLDDMARQIGTISREISTRLGPRVYKSYS